MTAHCDHGRCWRDAAGMEVFLSAHRMCRACRGEPGALKFEAVTSVNLRLGAAAIDLAISEEKKTTHRIGT